MMRILSLSNYLLLIGIKKYVQAMHLFVKIIDIVFLTWYVTNTRDLFEHTRARLNIDLNRNLLRLILLLRRNINSLCQV